MGDSGEGGGNVRSTSSPLGVGTTILEVPFPDPPRQPPTRLELRIDTPQRQLKEKEYSSDVAFLMRSMGPIGSMASADEMFAATAHNESSSRRQLFPKEVSPKPSRISVGSTRLPKPYFRPRASGSPEHPFAASAYLDYEARFQAASGRDSAAMPTAIGRVGASPLYAQTSPGPPVPMASRNEGTSLSGGTASSSSSSSINSDGGLYVLGHAGATARGWTGAETIKAARARAPMPPRLGRPLTTPAGVPLADPIGMGFNRTPFPNALGRRQSPVPEQMVASRVAAIAEASRQPLVSMNSSAPGSPMSSSSESKGSSKEWLHGVPLKGSTQSGAGGRYWSLEFATDQRLEDLEKASNGGGLSTKPRYRTRSPGVGNSSGDDNDSSVVSPGVPNGASSLGSLVTALNEPKPWPASSSNTVSDMSMANNSIYGNGNDGVFMAGRAASAIRLSRKVSSPFRARIESQGSGYGNGRGARSNGSNGQHPSALRVHLWPTRDAADDWQPMASSLTNPFPQGRYGP